MGGGNQHTLSCYKNNKKWWMTLNAQDGKKQLFSAWDKLLLSEQVAQWFTHNIPRPEPRRPGFTSLAYLISKDFVLFKIKMRPIGEQEARSGRQGSRGTCRCIYITLRFLLWADIRSWERSLFAALKADRHHHSDQTHTQHHIFLSAIYWHFFLLTFC